MVTCSALPTMKTLDISIAGEINLDLILYGLPEVMPLERELLGTDFQITLGSSSAILAHNLAVLGTHVGFVTLVGEDALGKIALERLGESGADLSRVRVSKDGTATGVTLVLPHGTPRHILTYPGTMADMRLSDLDLDYLKSAKHFHLSSLFLQRALEPDLPALFKELKNAGLTISLDTNDDPSGRWSGVLPELLEYVDVLLPNEGEACRMAKKETLEEALEELARQVPCVAVKCGSRGSVVGVGGKIFPVRGGQCEGAGYDWRWRQLQRGISVWLAPGLACRSMCVRRKRDRCPLNTARGWNGSISRPGSGAKLFTATFFSWK